MADTAVNSTDALMQAMSATASASRKDDQSLSMDDFFQLMVAQLQNQDMFSPADDTQFLNQMAQFSMVNAMMDMQELSSVTYSMSLIGKQATVAFMTDAGQMESVTGIVEGVNLFNGEAEVVIGGEAYGMANVMSVAGAGSSSESALIAGAGLIGLFATAARGTDEGAETVRGRIDRLKLEDGDVRAYIDGKAYLLRELSELSAAQDETGAAGNP